MKLSNIELEEILFCLQSVLNHRDKIGYIAARNTRIIREELTEYFKYKQELLTKYGKIDKESQSMSIFPDSPNFELFIKEMDQIKDIQHDIGLMTIKYDDTVGILTGNEILQLEFMLED